MIILYTHSGCPGGERCKSFLTKTGHTFLLKDIIKDINAKKEFEKKGYFITPIIEVNGKTLIGFNEAELAHHLQN